ncbi:hypothetical protein HanXRQr2_Chr11g0510821 [Helianthus annuus]|uniref:Uncharacterized protein n=1 Tax=Helianthus annuus TaxID=4232 RepID=A0A9K3HSQ2_HELAN|nr:hypothetical protein HanXRQr2_Chr11g0510821 [Helianthus annuus]KAJ0876752.1 hypothetical protein HanPSC8_Chr11g0492051 [Helianthus annuus]
MSMEGKWVKMRQGSGYEHGCTRLCGLSIVMKNRRIEDRVKSKDCTEEQSRSFNYVMF